MKFLSTHQSQTIRYLSYQYPPHPNSFIAFQFVRPIPCQSRLSILRRQAIPKIYSEIPSYLKRGEPVSVDTLERWTFLAGVSLGNYSGSTVGRESRLVGGGCVVECNRFTRCNWTIRGFLRVQHSLNSFCVRNGERSWCSWAAGSC